MHGAGGSPDTTIPAPRPSLRLPRSPRLRGSSASSGEGMPRSPRSVAGSSPTRAGGRSPQRRSRSRSVSPPSPRGRGAWGSWSGRDEVRWVAEGGIRVRYVNKLIGGLAYRGSDGDMVSYYMQEGRLVLERCGERTPVDEVWFDSGLPMQHRPQHAQARIVGRRLSDLAVRMGVYRDADGQAGPQGGRQPPPPPAPVSPRSSPRDWDRPWRRRRSVSPTAQVCRVAELPRPSLRSRSRGRSVSAERASAGRRGGGGGGYSQGVSREAGAAGSYLNTYRERVAGAAAQAASARAARAPMAQQQGQVPPPPPRMQAPPTPALPFCPQCGQRFGERSITPFCPQSGRRHNVLHNPP